MIISTSLRKKKNSRLVKNLIKKLPKKQQKMILKNLIIRLTKEKRT